MTRKKTNKQTQNKKIDLSGTWQTLSQRDVYRRTKEPQPDSAIELANTAKFHDNSAAYAWNNEPVHTLKTIMSYEGKKGIGVAASGDQSFIFLQLGLREYLSFDISQVACFWVELKRAAQMHLSKDEFERFMNGKKDANTTRRRSNLYDGLRQYVSVYTRTFFDKVIDATSKDTIYTLLNDRKFFRGTWRGDVQVPYCETKEQYEILQRKMCDAQFKTSWQDIDAAMRCTPNEKFDLIFISNILDRWPAFGCDMEQTLLLFKERLAQDKKARIIGNYQLGYNIASTIQESAKKTGLLFTPHVPDTYDYWTMQHEGL